MAWHKFFPESAFYGHGAKVADIRERPVSRKQPLSIIAIGRYG